jgi:hypothetical protein
VLFKGIRVDWDSCDCGDGYGCSHGSWPYQIVVMAARDLTIYFEEDNLLFERKIDGAHTYMNLPVKRMTIGDFARACEIMGVALEFKNN